MEFDADWLPYKLDLVLQRVLWVRLPADARAAAAFLDDRALPAGVQGVWAPLDSLAGLPATPPADALLHIGHCGSTLLSRVIEAWPGVQALREPVPLRTLAAAWPTRGAAWASQAISGSPPSCGTTRSIWSPTSPSRRWARSCMP